MERCTDNTRNRARWSALYARWKRTYVYKEMQKYLLDHREERKGIEGKPLNDLGNLFIWSGFNFYLRQPTDSYVLFSPIKYWKVQKLISKKFLGGFAGDRKHFHARKHVCVCVILWSAEEDEELDSFEIDGYDIDQDGNLVFTNKLPISHVHTYFSKTYYDRRPIDSESRVGVLCGFNGKENTTGRPKIKPAYDRETILGYMVTDSAGFDQPDLHSHLLVAGAYNGNGFFLRKDNYLQKLPLFAASRYISYCNLWTERGRVMKSGDGSEKYNADIASGELTQWLLKCLLFTCLEYRNHMRSFLGSDNRSYRNELCLDITNGVTLAVSDLEGLDLGSKELDLLISWKSVMRCAKNCSRYNSDLTYGIYQIGEDLDTSHVDPETEQTVYDYPELHGHVQTLKNLVKEYYFDEIVPTLFKYEFLK